MFNQFAGMGMNTLFGGLTTGNWGGTSKERKNQIHDIRTLRRREYQDMMHSMREAGLNPILASGATPGHSAAAAIPTQIQQGDLAAHRKAGIGEGKMESEVELTTAKQALTEQERINTVLGRAGILKQYERAIAEIENIQQQTYTNAVQARLLEKKGNLTDAETNRLKAQQPMLEQTGGYGADPAGIIRQFLIPWANSALDAYRKE